MIDCVYLSIYLSIYSFIYVSMYLCLYKLVHNRSDTDLGNTQSAPRGGERATSFIYLYLPHPPGLPFDGYAIGGSLGEVNGVRTYVCGYVWLFVCTHLPIYLPIYLFIHICMHSFIYIQAFPSTVTPSAARSARLTRAY